MGKQLDLILVGGINLDRLHLKDGTIVDALGGDITHQLRVYKNCYPQLKVGVVSAVGSDVDPADYCLFSSADLEGVESFEGKTPFFEIAYDDNGDEVYLKRNLNIALKHSPKIPDSYQADRLVFSSLDPDFLASLKEGREVLFSTVPYWTEEKPGAVLRAMRHSTVCILDAEERSNLGEPLEKLALNTRNLIVTYGVHGSALFQGREKLVLPAYPVERVSPCGAGDAYKAAFTAEILKERDIRAAVVIASAVASMYVDKDFRFQSPEENQREIDKRVKKISSKISQFPFFR